LALGQLRKNPYPSEVVARIDDRVSAAGAGHQMNPSSLLVRSNALIAEMPQLARGLRRIADPER
jgi:hypothetical protein